jgi:hypothetical protein
MAHPEITASFGAYGPESKRMNPWGEVQLQITFDPPSGAWQSDNRGTMTIELTRGGARAVEDAIRDGMRSRWGGKSICELLLDDLLDLAVALRDGTAGDVQYTKGRAAGLASAIALMRNPYDPNDGAVRDQIREKLGIAKSAQRQWLESRTVKELHELASGYCPEDIEIGMRKDELVAIVDRHDMGPEMKG